MGSPIVRGRARARARWEHDGTGADGDLDGVSDLGFSPSGPQRVGQSLRNLTDIAESVGTPLAVSPRSPR